MEMDTVSVVKLGLNNNKELIIDINYEVFEGPDDIEPLYLIVAAMEKIKIQLLDLSDTLLEDEEENDDIDDLLK